jgi:hypothetical protein
MNTAPLRPRIGQMILIISATLYGCGDATEPTNESTQSSKALGQPATTTIAQSNGKLTSNVSQVSGAIAADHGVVDRGGVNAGLTTQPTAITPGPPLPADGHSQAAGNQLVAPIRRIALPTDCVVDFTDKTMLQLTGPSLWADRIYPSRIDPDGTCHYVDIATEPRTYITRHDGNERFRLAAQRPDGRTWAAFDLNRFRVVGSTPVKVCYKKKATASGPWVTTDPTSSTPGSSWCWNELGQGLWDLSGWAYELNEVTIQASPAAPGAFQLDDFHIAIRY